MDPSPPRDPAGSASSGGHPVGRRANHRNMADPTTVVVTPPATPAPVKPGYKTTEFWLSCAAMALSAAFASGALNNTEVLIAGFAASVLVALGYSVSRAMVKSA